MNEIISPTLRFVMCHQSWAMQFFVFEDDGWVIRLYDVDGEFVTEFEDKSFYIVYSQMVEYIERSSRR